MHPLFLSEAVESAKRPHTLHESKAPKHGHCRGRTSSTLMYKLLQLWAEPGVKVWDEHKQEPFDLRALLFVTINNWSALSNISGQSNKRYNTCTHCLDKTKYTYLDKCKKVVYLGCRQFLPTNHQVSKKERYILCWILTRALRSWRWLRTD
jgi:hypothetical protein